jgi:hypothetical protein
VFKKIMLFVASLAVIAVAYAIYQWQGETVTVVSRREAVPLPPRTTGPASTRPGGTGYAGIPIRGGWMGGGVAPVLRVYDKKGNTRIVFRATRWDPISDSEFDLFEPMVRLTLPGGQLAYIWADEGRVVVLQGEGDNPVAKRGQLRGNVRLFIDLTDESWRDTHPEQADLDQHPESVLKLWLEYVRFDLDLSFLDSDGPILLQSAPGDLEGTGLKIVWNELDRRIQQLTIAQGRRAVLRNADLAGMPSGRPKGEKGTASAPSAAAPTAGQAASAPTENAAPHVARIVQPTEPGELPYIELSGRKDRPVGPRVETYRLVFRDNVAAAQKEGGRVVGGLRSADTLELLFDFNQADRRAMGRQATQPAGEKPTTTPTGEKPTTAPARVPALAQSPGSSAVELTWTGPLEIRPAPRETGEAPSVNRAHLIARGSAVEVYSQDAGRVVCPELEYRDETQQVWLRGTKDTPVILEPSERQQLIAQGTVSADQKKGTARIDGPGRLADRGQPGAASAPAETGLLGGGDSRKVEIAWENSVDLEFAPGEASIPTTTAPAHMSPIPKGAYLKHAVFADGATFSDERRSIHADRIEVAFGKPRNTSRPGDAAGNMVVEHMTATGHVRMTVRGDEVIETVDCERLEVELGVDDAGNNVPKVARAVGRVVARQTGHAAKWGPGAVRETVLREIQAQDELILDMTSLPKIVAPEEIARIEAAARAAAKKQNIAEGSPKWKENEERLRRRLDARETVARRLRANGRVTVFDVKQELDLAADSIDCELGRRREEIRKALIVGREDRPARVEIGEFYIRGSRIDVDVVTQSAQVPGAGTLRFMTRQDLDGRAVDKPIPVVLAWDKQMWLAGDRNTGRVVGNVRAVSETVKLSCRNEMQLEFESAPQQASAATRPAEQRSEWVFAMIADAVNPPVRQKSENRANRQIRKRLRSLEAIDETVITAEVRQEGSGKETVIDEWLSSFNGALADLLPAGAKPPSTRPATVPSRLASRVRVAGPRILIRLDEKQMLVEGPGNLLVEDYRMRPGHRGGSPTGAGGPLLGGSSVTSLENMGPNQTLFIWANSMSFLNNRNTAIFDSGVQMQHLSGSKMIELARVAAAAGIDPQRLRQLPGREASLTCDRFTVEFERDAKLAAGQAASLSRATRLKGFWAVGRQVRLEESGRFVEGTDVSFDSATQLGKVTGSTEFPSRLGFRDERTGYPQSTQVEQFEWDQRTGVIKVRDIHTLATGK